MNDHTNHRNGHRPSRLPWRRIAIIGAALTGIAAAHGTTASADARDTGPRPTAPIWEQVAQRDELRRLVAMMPAGWPATEAMSDEAERPLGDVAERARWRQVVELMPAGWPATEAMQAELAR